MKKKILFYFVMVSVMAGVSLSQKGWSEEDGPVQILTQVSQISGTMVGEVKSLTASDYNYNSKWFYDKLNQLDKLMIELSTKVDQGALDAPSFSNLQGLLQGLKLDVERWIGVSCTNWRWDKENHYSYFVNSRNNVVTSFSRLQEGIQIAMQKASLPPSCPQEPAFCVAAERLLERVRAQEISNHEILLDQNSRFLAERILEHIRLQGVLDLEGMRQIVIENYGRAHLDVEALDSALGRDFFVIRGLVLDRTLSIETLKPLVGRMLRECTRRP